MEILIIAIAAFLSSAIGVSTGGAGLILLPILIFVGLDPKIAVATATFGYLSVASTGLYKFSKSKKVDWPLSWRTTIDLTIGSVIGSLILLYLPTEFLRRLIGVFLIIVLCFLLFSKNVGLRRRETSKLSKNFGHLLINIIGIYKGAVNSGSSILVTYVLVFSFGQTYLESSGTRKLPFLISMLASVFIFIYNDLIHWPTGIILFITNIFGAYVGAHYIIKKGNGWFKYGFAVVVLLSAIKLIV